MAALGNMLMIAAVVGVIAAPGEAGESTANETHVAPVSTVDEAHLRGNTVSMRVLTDLGKSVNKDCVGFSTKVIYIPPACEGCKDKVILMVLHMMGLAVFGIHRCYMGSLSSVLSGIAQGVLVFVTFICNKAGAQSMSGPGPFNLCAAFSLIVWILTDTIIVMVNAIQTKESIDVLGMEAKFYPDGGANSAQTLAYMMLVLLPLSCCGSFHFVTQKGGNSRGLELESSDQSEEEEQEEEEE